MANCSYQRFLIVRLGSMGDIVHTLPAALALADSFPGSPIDWLVDRKWSALLQGNPDLNEIISIDTRKLADILAIGGRLRIAGYTAALDFQSLYKSALLARLSGAKQILGFDWKYSRESPASLLYTKKIHPQGTHKIDHNLDLARAAGAAPAALATPRFNFPISAEADQWVAAELKKHAIDNDKFFVISPGGGWRSKCWPAERYGQLHAEIARRTGLRAIINFGPGEDGLVTQLIDAASEAARVPHMAVSHVGGYPPNLGDRAHDLAPIPLQTNISQLISLLRRAQLIIAADTGPLHLAAALGTPALALFGPTDPARNGPWSQPWPHDSTRLPARTRVIRHAEPNETTYKRGDSYSQAMLRIAVPEVTAAAIEMLERA
jgi:ADP-heptose:LPS heptosyltransferase